jgi:hypothetical protein
MDMPTGISLLLVDPGELPVISFIPFYPTLAITSGSCILVEKSVSSSYHGPATSMRIQAFKS